MAITSHLIDKHGNPISFLDEAMLTHMIPYPPDLEQKQEIWQQDLTDDGTSSGDNDMRVAAGDVPKEFWVIADADHDIYITSVLFQIGDSGAILHNFGATAPLATGCQFFYRKANGDTVYIAEDLTTNWRFIKMCGCNPAFGNAGDAFKARNAEGWDEVYVAIYDFTTHFNDGLRLAAGSNTRLSLNVRSATDGVDGFTASAYGKKVIRD